MPDQFWEEHWKLLESEGRMKMQPAEPLVKEIIKVVKVRNTAFDVGAGTGYYTIPLSKIFKRVFAVEMNEKMIEVLLKKLKEHGIKNVGIIKSKEPPLIEFNVDFVLFANVLHEMDEALRKQYLIWASKANSICVVDWKEDSELRPERWVDKIEVTKILRDIGFTTKEIEIYKHHYVIFAIR